MKNFAKSNKNGLIVLAVVVAAGIAVWAAIHFTRTPAFSQVQLYEVKKGAIESELSEDVALKAGTDMDLAFENAGKIKNVYVAVGDQVKKGQLLAEEDNGDFAVALRGATADRDAAAAQLKQAQEDVDIQKAKLQALKNANAKKYDVKAQKETKDKSQAGVDAEEALLSAAQSAVDEANLDLAKTRLTAPMDGVITDKSIEPGEVVAQASSVMKLATADNLEAWAYVSELDVRKLRVGDEAEIRVSSVDGNSISLDAKIKNIYPSETSQNGASAYKIVFGLAGQSADLKSGMTGTAKIKLSGETSAVYIPQSSLFSDAGKKYVMVMSGGFPQRKEVQTGAYGVDGTVQILSGLAEGDKIIKF